MHGWFTCCLPIMQPYLNTAESYRTLVDKAAGPRTTRQPRWPPRHQLRHWATRGTNRTAGSNCARPCTTLHSWTSYLEATSRRLGGLCSSHGAQNSIIHKPTRLAHARNGSLAGHPATSCSTHPPTGRLGSTGRHKERSQTCTVQLLSAHHATISPPPHTPSHLGNSAHPFGKHCRKPSHTSRLGRWSTHNTAASLATPPPAPPLGDERYQPHGRQQLCTPLHYTA